MLTVILIALGVTGCSKKEMINTGTTREENQLPIQNQIQNGKNSNKDSIPNTERKPNSKGKTTTTGSKNDQNKNSAPSGRISIFSNIDGVYALGTGNTEDKDLNSDAILNNPNIDGLSIRLHWDQIEPSEGNYDWSVFDDLIAKAKAAGKKAMLRVTAGAYTPGWVYAAGAQKVTATDQNSYHSTYGQQMTMPVPWDNVYLQKWTEFIKAFGERYRNDSSVVAIQMTGPSDAAEMYLGGAGVDNNKTLWSSYGWSPDKLVNAWKETIDAYAAAFPGKQLIIDISNPVTFDNPQQMVSDILSYGYQKLGAGFSVQGNWLAAKTNPSFSLYQMVESYSSKTTVGFQMLWFVTNDPSNRMGGTLRQAIDKGLQAGAKYMEIYSRDLNNSSLAGDIEYAHEQLDK